MNTHVGGIYHGGPARQSEMRHSAKNPREAGDVCKLKDTRRHETRNSRATACAAHQARSGCEGGRGDRRRVTAPSAKVGAGAFGGCVGCKFSWRTFVTPFRLVSRSGCSREDDRGLYQRVGAPRPLVSAVSTSRVRPRHSGASPPCSFVRLSRGQRRVGSVAAIVPGEARLVKPCASRTGRRQTGDAPPRITPGRSATSCRGTEGVLEISVIGERNREVALGIALSWATARGVQNAAMAFSSSHNSGRCRRTGEDAVVRPRSRNAPAAMGDRFGEVLGPRNLPRRAAHGSRALILRWVHRQHSLLLLDRFRPSPLLRKRPAKQLPRGDRLDEIRLFTQEGLQPDPEFLAY